MRATALIAVAVAAATTATIVDAQLGMTQAISRALSSPARTDQRPDDERRRPGQLIAFAGIKANDVVVDYLPGSGYWTRIFTTMVGPRGRVYALWPAGGAKYAEKSLPALKARNLANVVAEVQATNLPTAPVPVDVFWTAQNYHDIPNKGGGEAALSAFNAAVFKMLRKGGTYIVIDHADAPGSGLKSTATTHRIDPATVRQQVEAAGFRFDSSSDALRNPADDHSKNVFDPTIRGKTDQFVYKFRKP